MPCQKGAEVSNDRRTSVVIKVVKCSAMNKPKKEAGIGPYLKKSTSGLVFFQRRLDSEPDAAVQQSHQSPSLRPTCPTCSHRARSTPTRR